MIDIVEQSDMDELLAHSDSELGLLQEEPSQLDNDIHVPKGVTRGQAVELFRSAYKWEMGHDWDSEKITSVGYGTFLTNFEADWRQDPQEWPEYSELQKLISIIDRIAPLTIHPASGMSSDDFKLLILAHFRQEGHYRRQIGHNVFDVLGNLGKNTWSLITTRDPSVGPSNLRPKVVDEMAGQNPYIPMPPGYARLEFDDMGLLDDFQSIWPTFDVAERLAHLMDDETAIRLTAANINRGVERLFVLYLYDRFEVNPREDIYEYLEERGHQRDDLIRDYLEQEDYRASMFKMYGWLSQGIPESDSLRYDATDEAHRARKHASGGVRSASAIVATGAFGFPTAWGDFRMFNDDDIYAYGDE